MILILGSSADALVETVFSRGESKGLPVKLLSEEELFDGAPFSFERDGQKLHGTIHLDGEIISLREISSALIRLTRTWWPSAGFNPKDQMFVYHETTAAWFSLITSLSCPLINRFNLGWWLQDVSYPELLRRQMADLLELETTAYELVVPADGRLYPTRPDTTSTSVYIVGERLIASSPRAELLAERLDRSRPRLASWQVENGISLCRLDFESDGRSRLKYIEVFPLIDDEHPDLIEQIGAASMALLT